MDSREEDRKVPLLGPRWLASAAEHGENSVIGGGHAEEEAGLGRLLLEENQKLWKVAGPAICTRFSGFGTTIISLAFIGHIGPTELAGFALVSTVLMRFCNGILVSYKVVAWCHCTSSGKFLQRSWIILSSCAVLMLPLFLFTEPLLVFIGQDPKIAVVAGLISLWYIPIMFANLCNFTLQMYLQAQSKNIIVTYLAFVNLGTHLFLSWLLTVKFQLGLAGVMTSMVVALWIPVTGQLIFVFCGACPLTWTGFSSEALTDLFPILKLSLSSGVMIEMDSVGGDWPTPASLLVSDRSVGRPPLPPPIAGCSPH